MKKQFCYSIVVALAVWQVFADDPKTHEWGAVTNNFQMSINLKGDKNEITTNQPCILLIRYRNVSTNEMFRVFEANGTVYDPSYSFVVISPSGKDISPDMKKVRSGDSWANHEVGPNQTVEIEFNLTYLCKLNEVGTYKIIAKKGQMWSVARDKEFTVVSNPLNVLVIPNQDK
jgi:hypothetical protein